MPITTRAPESRTGGQRLPGGTANRGLVVRVGDTVVRPAAPCWRATHALLGHLSDVGFDGSPRMLEVGPVTETLTYIEGKAAVPPLAEDTLTDPALVSVADLLRRYHSAASSSTRPATPGPTQFRTVTARAWSATTTCTQPTWCSATGARSR